MSFSVYIDPGHGEGVSGNYDPGAVGPGGLTENEVAFDVAKRLAEILRQQGIDVAGNTLAADSDEENLNEAVRAANAAGVDLYVSLHCNSAVTAAAHGVEVWYGGSKTSIEVASAVLERITAEFAEGDGELNGRTLPLVGRGVKKGSFAVLRNTHMPAILVEMAFISNEQEEGWLRDYCVRQQFAQAIADGIIDAMG